MQKQQKGGGAKKIGRHLADCLRYKMQGRREKNKKRKMAKQARIEAKKRARKAARLEIKE